MKKPRLLTLRFVDDHKRTIKYGTHDLEKPKCRECFDDEKTDFVVLNGITFCLGCTVKGMEEEPAPIPADEENLR